MSIDFPFLSKLKLSLKKIVWIFLLLIQKQRMLSFVGSLILPWAGRQWWRHPAPAGETGVSRGLHQFPSCLAPHTGLNNADTETVCEHVYVALEKTNAIKAGFGHGGTVPMDAQIRVIAVFLPIREKLKGEDKTFLKNMSL